MIGFLFNDIYLLPIYKGIVEEVEEQVLIQVLKLMFLKKNQVFAFKFQVSRALYSKSISSSFHLSSLIFSTEFSLSQSS